MPKIAILQMCSGIDPEANFTAIEGAVREAASQRASVLFTPEMSLLLDRDRKRALEDDGSQTIWRSFFGLLQ